MRSVAEGKGGGWEQHGATIQFTVELSRHMILEEFIKEVLGKKSFVGVNFIDKMVCW